jgi:hypothetical protein
MTIKKDYRPNTDLWQGQVYQNRPIPVNNMKSERIKGARRGNTKKMATANSTH